MRKKLSENLNNASKEDKMNISTVVAFVVVVVGVILYIFFWQQKEAARDVEQTEEKRTEEEKAEIIESLTAPSEKLSDEEVERIQGLLPSVSAPESEDIAPEQAPPVAPEIIESLTAPDQSSE